MASADHSCGTADAAFGAAEMQRYFVELDDALVRAGAAARLHLFVAGGAVIATKSDTRHTTDVDVVSEGMTELLRRCVADVSARHRGLRADWLNDDAKVKRVNLPMEPERIYDGRRLVIDSAGDRYVLAMKLASGRQVDEADCELLIRSLGITQDHELFDLIQRAVPESRQHPALPAFAAERLRHAHRRRRRPPRTGGGVSLQP